MASNGRFLPGMHMKQLTQAQLRSRKNFRMLRIAAETGLDMARKKRNAKKLPGPKQLELFPAGTVTGRQPQNTGNLQKVKRSGLYVPPHIEKIAGNTALLLQELQRIQRSLDATETQITQVQRRDKQGKRDLEDEKFELRRELHLVEHLLGLKKMM